MRPNTRDDFTRQTKRILADRVAWRCSVPGCSRVTIGPKGGDATKAMNVGEAAHINGASPQGPRPDPLMSAEERKSLDNGIWMCRHHARLIDADSSEYSASTLPAMETSRRSGGIQRPIAAPITSRDRANSCSTWS